MKLRANVRPQWQWAKLKQLLAIVLMFWGTISMYGKRLSKYIFYSSFSLLTFATKK